MSEAMLPMKAFLLDPLRIVPPSSPASPATEECRRVLAGAYESQNQAFTFYIGHDNMPKLSPSLKSLVSLPRSSPSPLPALHPRILHSTLDSIRSAATNPSDTPTSSSQIGSEAWLTVATAAGVTVNSPETFVGIWQWARGILNSEGIQAGSGSGSGGKRVEGLEAERWGAGLMREVGLKCISFNGIPRTINALNALRDALPEEITSGLSREATRQPTPANIDRITAQSRELWDAIYAPQHEKLISKLSDAHPDLIVHILNSHYGALLSDPDPHLSTSTSTAPVPRVGRVLTSMIAISCLRAQGGVGPQVLSHVYGLLKAADQPGEEGLQGRAWLTSEEGVKWVLESTDKICEAVRGGRTGDSTNAGEQELRAKL